MVIFNPNLLPEPIRVDCVWSVEHLRKVMEAYGVLSGLPCVDARVRGRFSDAVTGETREHVDVYAEVGDDRLLIGGKPYTYLAPFTAILGATDAYVERELQRMRSVAP